MNTEQIIEISVAKHFSQYPAGRYPEDGDFNGTRFREEKLAPPLIEGKTVEVTFEGVAGLGSSFLEEAFGGLVREHHLSKEFLDEHLRLVAGEDELQDFVLLARKYIKEAGIVK